MSFIEFVRCYVFEGGIETSEKVSIHRSSINWVGMTKFTDACEIGLDTGHIVMVKGQYNDILAMLEGQ